MSHFEEFCKSTPKNKHGYVPDLLDMENDAIRDQATVAMLKDLKRYHAAEDFHLYSDDLKGEYYRSLEIVMQDEVDKYNDIIDSIRESEFMAEIDGSRKLLEPDYKYQHFNQAMYDAGHKESDFC